MEDIVTKLIRLQKSNNYKDRQMARIIGCSRQLYQMTRTHKITPGKKILTFFITGEADRLYEKPQDGFLGALKAKDTVMEKYELESEIEQMERRRLIYGKARTPLLVAQIIAERQAEISFKTGYNQGRHEGFGLHLNDMELGRKAGIREVVEWIMESLSGCGFAHGSALICLKERHLKAKLKEWNYVLLER